MSSQKNSKDYLSSVDIGTNSIGFAVTDTDYNILKKNGKRLIGIRLFDEASPAIDRRIARCARRRLERRNKRLNLLRELFDNEISKKDENFFLRLSESKYHLKDKHISEPYALFAQPDYTDIKYHNEYPTIYHLRRHLMDNSVDDIRLYYLAIAHILKHRGHFLFEGQNIAAIKNFEQTFKHEFIDYLYDNYDIEFTYDKEIETTLSNTKLRKIDKIKQISNQLNAEKNNKQQKEIISAIVGSKVTPKILFNDDDLEDFEPKSFSFADKDYDEILTKIPDEYRNLLEKLKAVYDWMLLINILGNNEYISDTKIESYEKHKHDLKILKKTIKSTNDTKTYDQIFRNQDIDNNYPAYISKNKTGKPEDFYKLIAETIKDIDNADVEYITAEINLGTFLPKQKTISNSVIPYQLHYAELEMILNTAIQKFEFLNTKDGTGLTISEKIKKIFLFRRPYYVGPVNDSHINQSLKQCWVVKKTNDQLLPWNLEDVVDTEKTAEQFIKRMTRGCTYLTGENVLPADSLLYSRFTLLNEINNLKINGYGISIEAKQAIYNKLFKDCINFKKPTIKRLIEFLYQNGYCKKNDILTGIDKDIKSNLKSYRDFKQILGDKINEPETEHMVENIIETLTIFGNDKKMIKRQINNQYGDKLTQAEIENISKLKYQKWGKISRKMLDSGEIYHINNKGETYTIIQAMWDTNENFMQLLSEDYGYISKTNNYNKKQQIEYPSLTYQQVDELYVSPAVKRQIWQTLLVIKDIVAIMGKPPKKIMIEMARYEGQKGDKGRTTSRKNNLKALYEKIKDEPELYNEIKETTPDKFKIKKLYLYYLQMGRCMYTGNCIDLSQLFNKNLYNIDHIHPRAKVIDNSFTNMVLVEKIPNTEKSDEYPIKQEIRDKMEPFWRMLTDKGLCPKEKYERLTRATKLTTDEKAGFVARQLTETHQATKETARILKEFYTDTQIVYSKAINVSEFRQKFGIIKVREVNDLHHAHDAYLNIVVGNVYNTKFTNDPRNFIKTNNVKYSVDSRIFDHKVERNEYVAWQPAEKGITGTIEIVKKTLTNNDIRFTRMSSEKRGAISDLNPVKSTNNSKKLSSRTVTPDLPLKSRDERLNDMDKYGGYNSLKGSYFMLIEHTEKAGTKKETRIRTIVHVPVYLADRIGDDLKAKLDYCQSLGYDAPDIRLDKIKFNALLNIDGCKLHVSGRSGNRISLKLAEQLIISNDDTKYIKKITSFINNGDESIIENDNMITAEKNINLYQIFKDKLSQKPYNVHLSAQKNTLDKYEKTFEALSTKEQMLVLIQILNLFTCNPVAANLKLLTGASKVGQIMINSKITGRNIAQLIHQSPTGVYESTIDLLTI